jgi:hypothetical protein
MIVLDTTLYFLSGLIVTFHRARRSSATVPRERKRPILIP